MKLIKVLHEISAKYSSQRDIIASASYHLCPEMQATTKMTVLAKFR